jgi:hypothetical protein
MVDDRPLVFISHVAEDGEATRILQNDLARRFIDAVEFFNTSNRDSLKPGESWLEKITGMLRKSSMILPILSPAALRSPWVNFETGGGWLTDTRVVPCCAGQVRKESLPAPYSWLQAINLDEEEDLSRLVQLIAEQVHLRATYDGLAELASELRSALALSATETASNFAGLGNRIDKYVERQWKYRRSDHDPSRWAASYYYRSEVRVTDSTMDSILTNFAPAVESVSFSLERPPVPELKSWARTSPGLIRLAEPHRRTGSSFAFRVYFDPPLKCDDEATIELTVDFPEYRLGTREDYVMAQLQHGAAIQDYLQNAREISRQTDMFVYRIIIPKALGASPLDPTVTRFESRFGDEERFLLEEPSVYSVREEDHDGESCWVMEIVRSNPPYRANYRIRWSLPRKKDLGLL